VADAWTLCSDDPRERATFATLAATLARPGTPAGPRNRLRSVARIDTPHGVYFLKTFQRTQWNNRVRFAVTAPRAANDALRELRVTQALRAAGFAAPRPVAHGTRGASSFYLCAQLPGTSWRMRLERGADGALGDRVARHCGALLAAGCWLPDLGADHVFVPPDANAPLAVLDLHNGQLGRAGAVPRRVLRRVLRRFRRSVRDLLLPPRAALRFAVRLLRSARAAKDTRRALLRAEPPWATAARYDAPGKSAQYAQRNPARAARELDLLRRVWPGTPGERVLDLPCGTGRLLPLLARELGHEVVMGDGALAMVREARARAAQPVRAVVANALALPFRDGAADGVVMFRFLHHLPPDAAAAALAQACRVARRFVVVSFFHRVSVHHARRSLRALLGGERTRFATTLRALDARMARHGFRRVARAADRAFAKDLWVAAYVRGVPPR
jgi:ubiquinone/menaquinone biosynthesis C-methylase UbiE